MTKRIKIIGISGLVIVLLLSLLILRIFVEREVNYYDNGQLEHKVYIVNGKYEGQWTNYFENGIVRARTQWKNGMMNGLNTIYYKDGVVRQNNIYKQNICRQSKEYTENGELRKVTIFDSLGRIVDNYYFNKNGSRDFNRKTKDPIFIPEGDTLILGVSYYTEIRLGNRQFDNVEVIIGDIRDMYIAEKNKPLPKKDSLTSIITIRPDSIGNNEFSGVIIERSAISDSLDVIPFTHRFFVKRNSMK